MICKDCRWKKVCPYKTNKVKECKDYERSMS